MCVVTLLDPLWATGSAQTPSPALGVQACVNAGSTPAIAPVFCSGCPSVLCIQRHLWYKSVRAARDPAHISAQFPMSHSPWKWAQISARGNPPVTALTEQANEDTAMAGSCPSLCTHQQWCFLWWTQASLYTLTASAHTTLQPPPTVSTQPTQSSSQICPLKLKLQHPVVAHTSSPASWAGDCLDPRCRFLFVLSAAKQLLCSLSL